MRSCKGCRQQQTNDVLCLTCIEDLNCWLREIPDLYEELNSVRLPGSVRIAGPRTRSESSSGSASPVRLVVIDLLDRGEALRRLWKWTDSRTLDVATICDAFRHHLLATVSEPWAGDFWRAMRTLCRDLGRAVGQAEERPVGKCSEPVRDTDELCRGQLFRASAGGVYCRRCGHKPELKTRAVWVSCQHAAMVTGRPVKTVRTWRDRGKAERGRWPAVSPDRVWLPDVVRLAEGTVATFPQARVSLSPGSRAELSASRTALVSASGPTADSVAPIRELGSGTGGDLVSGETSAQAVQPYMTEDESRSVDGHTARSTRATGSQQTPSAGAGAGEGEAAPATGQLAGAHPSDSVPVAPPTAGTDS